MSKVNLKKKLTALFLLIIPALPATSAPLPTEATQLALEEFALSNREHKEKIESFIKALKPEAEAGNPVAKFFLGGMLLSSDSDSYKNQAHELLRDSAEGGCAGASGILGAQLMKTDPPASYKWLSQAAEAGDTSSMLFLSTVYLNGNSSIQRNEAKALAWAELAAAQANSDFIKFTAQQLTSRINTSIPESTKHEAETLLTELQIKHPKHEPYLCGQSSPQS
ncbi:sel1 repeat family protein [Stutzerimonas zhaodongensis]|uniref:Sel1 repeat family protein n=1 Tax=Stutzerimonas zhaodongensis TaxID=1176257 RepID=A0A3M2HIN9_9GAMM|nr:SEL1-like repeat protein [Stutzerimonas zhaodongensis]MCQ4318621.1 SEL1-like repeat protein [Stutzerimonas zhaodongensis]RMH87440.1 sel1 repeat family protein [Stutzerimonas zhaodongensis]